MQAAKNESKRSQTEVGFRFSAAGREEEEVHNSALRRAGLRDALHIHQDECELECAPLWSLARTPAPGCASHREVGEFEGMQDVRLVEQGDALLDAVSGKLCIAYQILRRFPKRVRQRCSRQFRFFTDDPLPVGLDERHELFGGFSGRG